MTSTVFKAEPFTVSPVVSLFFLQDTAGIIHVQNVLNVIHGSDFDAKLSSSQLSFIQDCHEIMKFQSL